MSRSEIVIEKYDYIDALRGFAVLGVILTHCGYEIPGLSHFAQNLAIEGSRGVQLFFIVSAFTLFHSYSKRKAREVNCGLNFFIRRFFRIAPMFYLALVYYLYVSNSFSSVSWAHLLSVLTFTNGWHPHWINSIVPGGWSIAVEMTFYLTVPFLFKFIDNMKKAGWALFIILVISNMIHWIMLGYNHENNPEYLNFIFYFFPNQLPIFMIGIFLYFYQKKTIELSPPSYNLLLIFSIYMMIALVNGGFVGNTNNVEWVPYIEMWGVAFALFTGALSSMKRSSLLRKVFINKCTCFYGKVSFSAYLAHFTLIPLGKRVINKITIGYDIGPSYKLAMLWIVVSFLTLIVASATYTLIEKPGINLGNRLIRILDRRESKFSLEPSGSMTVDLNGKNR